MTRILPGLKEIQGVRVVDNGIYVLGIVRLCRRQKWVLSM
jgi:hypothetical protein